MFLLVTVTDATDNTVVCFLHKNGKNVKFQLEVGEHKYVFFPIQVHRFLILRTSTPWQNTGRTHTILEWDEVGKRKEQKEAIRIFSNSVLFDIFTERSYLGITYVKTWCNPDSTSKAAAAAQRGKGHQMPEPFNLLWPCPNPQVEKPCLSLPHL